MYYGKINKTDIANGEGVRVSLFVSGCRNRCKNCFNPETWNFKYGKPFNEETENEIIKALDKNFITGLTLLGGDPFEEENQKVLAPFICKIKKLFPNKDIWAYTGYTYEDILPNGKKHCNASKEMLNNIDILIDGPFIEELKDITLKFRGSSNQRIIKLNK